MAAPTGAPAAAPAAPGSIATACIHNYCLHQLPCLQGKMPLLVLPDGTPLPESQVRPLRRPGAAAPPAPALRACNQLRCRVGWPWFVFRAQRVCRLRLVKSMPAGCVLPGGHAQ